MKSLTNCTPALVTIGAVFILTTTGCGSGGDNNQPSEDTPPLVTPFPDEVPKSTPVAFVNVTVIPMTSEIDLHDHTVLVRDGLIDDLGPDDTITLPADAIIIDGSGYFVMPGLADMHIHPLCSPTDGTCFLGAKELEVYLANGVTTVLSLQDTSGTARNLVKENLSDPIKNGVLPGPSVYIASYAGGPNDLPGVAHPSQIVTTEQAGRDHVIASKQQGYDFIKVYDGINNDAFQGIVSQAQIENVGVIGHFPQIDPSDALSQGLNMVAHASAYLRRFFSFNLDPGLIPAATDLTVANRVYVNTTLGIEGKKVDLACANEEAFENLIAQADTRYANKIELDIWRSFLHFITDFPGCTQEIASNRYAFVQQYVKTFYDSGVKLVLGTDSPLVWGIPGFSAHEELQAVADLGLSPFATLTIATKNAGEFIGDFLPDAESFGTIEIGKRADLILVEENPLLDIKNVQKRAGVMARGRWFSEENLQKKLANVALDYSRIE